MEWFSSPCFFFYRGLQHQWCHVLLDQRKWFCQWFRHATAGSVHGGGPLHICLRGRLWNRWVPVRRISDSLHMFPAVKYTDWGFCPSFQRQLPKAGFPLWAEEEHSVLHPRDLRSLQFARCPLMGFLLDLPFLCSSTYLHRYVAKHLFKIIIIWKKWVSVIHALHQSLPKYCGLFYMLCQVVFNCCWDFSHLLYVYCCTDIRGCYQGWHPNKHWCCIESDPPPLQGAPRTQSF